MANLGNTIINGILRVNGKLSVSGDITASSFTGNLIGNATSATSATKATQDGNGAVISSTYTKKTGDTMTGNLTFSTSGSGSTPSIIFQRGTLTDDYNDWSIWNSSGHLHFGQRGINSTSFDDNIQFKQSGEISAQKFSGSLNGNATSASKLESAQTITVTGDLSGSVSFDGSEAKSFDVYNYNCSVNGGNKANYPYHRFAYVTGKTGKYTDTDGIFDIRGGFNGGAYGRIKISLRTNNNNSNCDIGARWLFRSGISEDTVTIAQWGKTRRGSLCRCIC